MLYKIVHIADAHSNNHNNAMMDPTLSFILSLDYNIKINCGDAVCQWFGQPFDENQLSDFCFTPGNHDQVTYDGAHSQGGSTIVYDWTQMPTQLEIYNQFYRNRQSPLDIIEGKSWGSKIIDGVLIVSYNNCTNQTNQQLQLTWLDGLLNDALTNNTPVLVITHMLGNRFARFDHPNAFTDAKHFPEKFDAQNYYNAYPLLDSLPQRLKQFKNNGGNLIALLAGHEHADAFDYHTLGAPMCVVASMSDDGVSDMRRMQNYTSQSIINYYMYDSHQQTLTIYRLGAGDTKFGGIRRMLVYSYAKNEIVSQYSF